MLPLRSPNCLSPCGPPQQGARCLVRAVFEVNRLFQHFQQKAQTGGFSFENLPAETASTAYEKLED